MKLAECVKIIEKHGGVIYKTRYNSFDVISSLWRLAIEIARKPPGICFYEVVSHKQCTYFDLDLKICDCAFIPHKLKKDNTSLVRQFLELLRWGYRNYLDMALDLETVIVGNGSGKDKISYHVMVYDGVYCWDTGLAKKPPYQSSNKHFVCFLRQETLQNPDI